MQISDYLEGVDVDPSKGSRDHDAPKGNPEKLVCIASIVF